MSKPRNNWPDKPLKAVQQCTAVLKKNAGAGTKSEATAVRKRRLLAQSPEPVEPPHSRVILVLLLSFLVGWSGFGATHSLADYRHLAVWTNVRARGCFTRRDEPALRSHFVKHAIFDCNPFIVVIIALEPQS
jgi:hypothetical protein